MIRSAIAHTPALDRLASAIATGFGAGLAPIGPGTLGAVEGVALFLAMTAVTTRLSFSSAQSLLVITILNVVVFAMGVWASKRVCEISGLKDPSRIVVDEVSGQLIALTPLVAPSAAGIIAAFVLFRVFDIFKPYPIRKLEGLRAGFGVMSDDALAGACAAGVVWLGILVI